MVFISPIEFQKLAKLKLFWWPNNLLRYLMLFLVFICSTYIPQTVCSQGEAPITHLFPSCMAELYFVPLFSVQFGLASSPEL